MRQDAFGPFVEIVPSTHKSYLHNQYGSNQPYPTHLVDRSEFNPIRAAYWKARANEFN